MVAVYDPTDGRNAIKSEDVHFFEAKKKRGTHPRRTSNVDELKLRRELGIPDDAPEDVARLQELGIGAAQVSKSTSLPELGPRSGLSDAARLLRGLRLQVPVIVQGHRVPLTPESFVQVIS